MRALFATLLLLGLASIALSRTWEVNADGSGDAPDLYAAIDSAASGDTVLVGPGHYLLPNRLRVWGIRLIGKNGPAETHLEAPANDVPTSGISLRGRMEGIHLFGISNFLLTVEGGEMRRCIIDGGSPVTATIEGGAVLL